ncbi:hypothetical protein KVT40_005191 [Elsinoe batatas]|uniref:Uncharacterized protein n=1 Tax=Elsinoe batatas TaxID=2601811 RepID=A0A8K0KY17_9PEZI|nr:hypothetical protein KVT40_005191 [Elsinoe batatas]
MGTLVAAKLSPFTPVFFKTLAAKTSLSSAMLYRLLISSLHNTRITPIATYLAYKTSGYSEQGPISGITISDFVSIWTPYNTGGPSEKGKSVKKRPGGEFRGKKEGPKRAEETASTIKGLVATDIKDRLTFGGTKGETGIAVMEKEGRESRPARQDIHFEKRRRHFCRQVGCEKSAL